jgi:hypothetical protein
MEYIDVTWWQGADSDPARLVSELDAQRYETRKLEFFSDGRVGFASAQSSTAGTTLGVAPIPPLDSINSHPQFFGASISAAEFEALWELHAKSAI